MKTILFLTGVFLFISAARECQAQPTMATYTCTLVRSSGTLTNVQLQLFATKACTIVGFGPAAGIPPQSGTWDQKQLVRTFSIMNSSNQYVGTINRGVVRGTFRNYVTGETGTLDAEP